MKERPILFSAPMVKAILEGRKTQTLRVINPQPQWDNAVDVNVTGPLVWPRRADGSQAGGPIFTDGRKDYANLCRNPYGQPGDHLWVRETWWKVPIPTEQEYRDGADTWPNVAYDADESDVSRDQNRNMGWKLRPSIFMPRWASRITLEVTEVRVQRLQDISREDCIAEGIEPIDQEKPLSFVKLGYQQLWDSINAKTHPWADNPWVWAITFKRVAQ